MNDKLDKIKAIAGEHFDDYLLVLVKDGDVHTAYNSKIAAMGMATMVRNDIKQDWRTSRDNGELV